MATDKNINIIIDAQNRTTGALTSAQRGMENFKSSVDRMQPAFQKMAAVGAVAFTAISAIAVSSFKSFADAQAQTEITNQSLQNTLDTMSKTSLASLNKSLKDGESAFANVANAAIEAGNAAVKLGFDDETAARSFAKLFAITKDVTKANKELSIAQDLARFKGISLEEATQKLVMVHSGATKELKMLGLAVDETASAEKNLDAIHRQVSGSAETFAGTAAGAMERIKVQMDNLKESIGGALAPAFEKILTAISPLIEKFSEWAQNNPELLAKIIMIVGGLTALVAVIGVLGAVMPAIITAFTILTSPITLVVAAIAALVAGIVFLINHWQLVKDKAMEVWNSMPVFIQDAVKAIFAPITLLIGFIKLIKDNWQGITDFFKKLWDDIKSVFQSAIDGIKAILQPVIDLINNIIAKIQSIGGAVGGGIKKAGAFVGNLLGFDTGGIVPGPVGAPQLAMVHGGETILPTHKSPNMGIGGGINIVIQNPTLLDSGMVQRLSFELSNLLRRDLRV